MLDAAKEGRLEEVQRLVRGGAVNVGARDNYGMTALLWAALNGHLEVVRWLLREGGSSVVERDNDGWTALLYAAYNGHLEVVRWLLSEGGSSIDEQTNDEGPDGKSLWNWVPKWYNEEDEDEDENEDDDVDEEAATACLRTCLTLGALPDGFDATTRLSPSQQELARKAVILRARLPAWLERRRSLVREGLPRCLPSVLGAVVQEYCEPSEDEVWDEVVGVPLGDDLLGEVVDQATEICRLQEENALLREKSEKDSGEIASLQEEIARLREEVERQEEGRGGRKRARGGH